MRRAVLAACGLLALLAPTLPSRAGEVLRGQPSVIDGDTLSLKGRSVGLVGIAAPGLGQTCSDATGKGYACGRKAATALAAHIGHGVVVCDLQGMDPFGRVLATCRKDGEDIAAWLAGTGLATADRRAGAAYVADETRAWAKRRGLWAGVFDEPAARQRETYPGPNRVAAARLRDRLQDRLTEEEDGSDAIGPETAPGRARP